MKNAELEELNRIHYEVTADQNLKIQDLKALNADLLEALKFYANPDNWKETEAENSKALIENYQLAQSAIAKAENK